MQETIDKAVRVSPGEAAKRRSAMWRGLTAEVVQFTAEGPFEYGFHAPVHLFIAVDRAVRSGGETVVEGLKPSTRRDFSRTMSFIPAGHGFHGSFNPRVLPRTTYFPWPRPSSALPTSTWRPCCSSTTRRCGARRRS
jgi:AraC family transcriptional regulator